MQTDPPTVQVIASARFQRDLRLLAKRYRNVRLDVQPVIEQLQSGELPGDQIPGLGCTIFKVRLKNRDVQKGKSGGYRLIYYVKLADQIVLITIYSKSDQGDITATEIQEIIAEFARNREL
ncbi:MAG: type II toxin-antitoxin system RelE/ParE family toxin [Leptolyngbya sp. IPPAS B-1204]|uniref:Type II toxin-antitoxin system RelE/ParE family toxin n=1 Tax=Leptolyngbya sp. NK1-12 TaxID=2547451 RepID=A0AA96WMJ7_9CYAN|nr:MAG: type II toxin-antitoxin system RelE/ParE family toxin [Leptolyngbya sp. IPPAS B-1204]WNZ24176.1 type II toxin-antitoxin system RelE/ParE family toxin [Leptolyngbya sp. NK1-12]